jgi:hypothetical protein
MKHWLAVIILAGFLSTETFGAAKGPEVRAVDSKFSIDVESISLGRLLNLFDRATGLQSTVPAALANRNLSVKFADLDFEDAVRKIFEGQPFDYIVVQRQGIVVTALSQNGTPETSPAPAAFNAPPQQIEQPSFIDDNPPPQPFVPPQPPVGAQVPPPTANPFNPQQQPAMIQTPFGPIPNPRAGQPVGGAQQATPFGTPAPFGNVNPFGPAGAFGQQQPPATQNNSNVFGNTSPPLFNQNQK